MRFEQACHGLEAKPSDARTSGRVAGGCSRTFRRDVARCREESLEGLTDKHIAQTSHLVCCDRQGRELVEETPVAA